MAGRRQRTVSEWNSAHFNARGPPGQITCRWIERVRDPEPRRQARAAEADASMMAHLSITEGPTLEEVSSIPKCDAPTSKLILRTSRLILSRPRLILRGPRLMLSRLRLMLSRPRLMLSRPRSVLRGPRLVLRGPRLVLRGPRLTGRASTYVCATSAIAIVNFWRSVSHGIRRVPEFGWAEVNLTYEPVVN